MICPTRTSSQVLIASRRIAAELVAEAMDPAADLTAADRRALARLALAVDVEALRRAGVAPVTGASEVPAEELASIEAAGP